MQTGSMFIAFWSNFRLKGQTNQTTRVWHELRIYSRKNKKSYSCLTTYAVALLRYRACQSNWLIAEHEKLNKNGKSMLARSYLFVIDRILKIVDSVEMEIWFECQLSRREKTRTSRNESRVVSRSRNNGATCYAARRYNYTKSVAYLHLPQAKTTLIIFPPLFLHPPTKISFFLHKKKP